MAIVPANNEVALLEEVNGLLDDQNIKDKSITDSRLEKPIIAGIVKENGERESGEGFTCEKTAVGTYKITLAIEFISLGAIVGLPISGAAGFIPAGNAPSKKIFTLEWYNTALEKKDAKFYFMIKAT